MKRASGIAVASLCVGAAALAASSVGLAQGTGTGDSAWYAGAAFGRSKVKDPDDTHAAWKIFGGYQLNRYFAAELGYTDPGEASESAGAVTVKFKSKMWQLAGLGFYPLSDRMSVHAKLGAYRAATDATTGIGASVSQTNTGLTYAFGGQYDFRRDLAARLEWQRYGKLGGGDIDKRDVDVVSIGLLWKFR
jgi:OmpA-OmpF porin, OOP family